MARDWDKSQKDIAAEAARQAKLNTDIKTAAPRIFMRRQKYLVRESVIR